MIAWTPHRLRAVRFGRLLAFHMLRAPSHGIFRFSVARRIDLSDAHRVFSRNGAEVASKLPCESLAAERGGECGEGNSHRVSPRNPIAHLDRPAV